MDLKDDFRHEEILHLASLAEVFGGFAHEIAQPLNAIMIASQVVQLKVQRSVSTDAEKTFLVQRLTMITQQAKRAADIVESLRGFARNDGGRMGEIHLMSIVRKVFGLMEQQFNLRSIEVSFEEDEGMIPVLEHLSTVEQVVVQMLAFSRDMLTEIGNRHTETGTPLQKQLKIKLQQNNTGQAVQIIWSRGELPKDEVLLDASTHMGLVSAATVLKARNGSFSVGPNGLSAVFSRSGR